MSEQNHSFEILPNDYEDSSSDVFDTKSPKLPKMCKTDLAFCQFCNQNVLEPTTKFFRGLPDTVVQEETALTNDRLLLYKEGEAIPEEDTRPIHKVTHFAVFDVEGHLCPFDTGLLESGTDLFFAGYVKPIYDEDPRPTNGVPVQELGPLEEWWISGFDSGNTFIIGFTSPFADYLLMDPSPDYESFMRLPRKKALLTKIVVEFLSNSPSPSYEALLSRINEVSVPDGIEPFEENCLGKHAQFIINQVRDVDDKRELLSTPAAQEIIEKFNLKVKSGGSRKKYHLGKTYKPTTTPLIREKFKFFLNPKFVASVPESGERLRSPRPNVKLSTFIWQEGTDSALVNDEVISVKDYVFINAESEKSNRIFRIERFFLENFTKKVHCAELIKGTDTILKAASHPREYFFLEECSDWPICKIISKANVVVMAPPKNWDRFISHELKAPEEGLFVQKTYLQSHGIFEDFVEGDSGTCGICRRKEGSQRANVPIAVGCQTPNPRIVFYDKVIWRNEEYRPGHCVFLEPFSVVFDAQKSSRNIEKTLVTIERDELIYPEFYRKGKEETLTEECPEPFVVGRIKNIFSKREGKKKQLFVTVRKFYRPENTKNAKTAGKRSHDFQLLFGSHEEVEVLFEHVRGKCEVVCSKTPPPVSPHPRFYFKSYFDAETGKFTGAPLPILKHREECSGPPIKLKTLNAFSGCGGLAEGLRQSGIAEICWAVEDDASTCRAFKSNFPSAVMFEKDCNLFLKDVMSGKAVDENGVRYPVKGEVEFLCGGPPCQGFSTMNRFSGKDELQYNNSLILTFLSLCDHYRPKYFLLENVRNFISYKRSIFLKHTLSCLVAMGYQCNFGVIQAGNYGVPQKRRRLFILAAAPGLALPNLPGPTHVFYESLKNFEYEVSGSIYSCRTSNDFSGSAAYRSTTILDAISDLPPLSEACKSRSHREERHYVRFLGGRPSEVPDHVSKEMSALNEARIKNIPVGRGCDWRDLPNRQVRLRDGSLTECLKYSYHDRKNGKSRSGLPRGVCRCASGMACDPEDHQYNTLIPWFLVHTGNRNNNWGGLYGRLDWEGVFNTVTTNPEPSGQQGKVLHPEENRVISVRECARAQGLPDSFKLFGTVMERYKQVGNAVPSPVARAIGFEIANSMVVKVQLDQTSSFTFQPRWG